MLHTLSHSPYKTDMDAVIRQIGQHDEILLFQDGVTAAIANNVFCERLLACNVPVYALQEDILARGLLKKISKSIVMITYQNFVELTAKHRKQFAW